MVFEFVLSLRWQKRRSAMSIAPPIGSPLFD